VHERLSDYLKSADIEFVDEVDVPRDYLDVHGRCDGICVIDSQAVVVEFKSINRRTVTAPKDEHVGQITWYMVMWKELRKNLKEDFGFGEFDIIYEKDLLGVTSLSGRTLDDLTVSERWLLFTQGEIRGELIYESKQTQQLFNFNVDFDQDRADKVRLWFIQLKWHVEHKQLPIVHYKQSSFPCSWSSGKCQYYDYCWNDEIRESKK
jgi:hypothetical protein